MGHKEKWAWLGGLIDGEGCIVINRQYASTRRDLRTDSFRLYVQVTMGDIKALQMCRKIAGCGSIQNHTVTNPRANAAFCWMVTAREAESLLRKLLPYLIVKQDEAIVALQFCKFKPWLPGGIGGNKKKSNKRVDAMATLYWKLRMLKSRWRFYRASLSPERIEEIRKFGLES